MHGLKGRNAGDIREQRGPQVAYVDTQQPGNKRAVVVTYQYGLPQDAFSMMAYRLGVEIQKRDLRKDKPDPADSMIPKCFHIG